MGAGVGVGGGGVLRIVEQGSGKASVHLFIHYSHTVL